MNKDAILASGIGFGIGLLITGGILLGPNIMKQFQDKLKPSGNVESATTTQDTITPTPIPETTLADLTIDEPTTETIVTKPAITIKGKAAPNSIIIIAGGVDETVVSVSQSPNYEGTITVKEGKNDLTVTNILNDTEVQKKVVVYLEPKL